MTNSRSARHLELASPLRDAGGIGHQFGSDQGFALGETVFIVFCVHGVLLNGCVGQAASCEGGSPGNSPSLRA